MYKKIWNNEKKNQEIIEKYFIYNEAIETLKCAS